MAAVKGGDGTIGYADFSQTNGITTVALKVGDDFNPPSAVDGAAAVVAKSPVADGRDANYLAISIDRTLTDARGDYPLLLTSYVSRARATTTSTTRRS